MSGFWSIVLNILIFIVSLGALIVIHELGHLMTAKLFKVYCYEFSIGMGPAIYQHKPKKEKGQETAFSVRALPIGGYVSMAGEDLEDAEGVDPTIIVPKDRTIEGKAHYKRIIIMAAGVCMNFILGYVMLLINFGCCTQTAYSYDSNQIIVVDESKASTAGLKTDDKITSISEEFYYIDANGGYKSTPDKTIPETSVTRYAYQSESEFDSYLDLNHTLSYLLSRDYSNGIIYYTSDAADGYEVIKPLNEGDKRVFYITYTSGEQENLKTQIEVTASYQKPSSSSFKSYLMYDSVGIGASYTQFKYSAGEAFQVAGARWGYYCSAIFLGVGSLFNPANWGQVGSIVSIFQISSTAVSAGIGSFLNLWAMISVNLAILNLLPFPGLDGWQIVITIGEWIALGVRKIKGTSQDKRLAKENLSEEEIKKIKQDELAKEAKRKKTYDKVKAIMSTVGLILLIGLSIVLIVKDFIFPALG